MGDSPDGIVLKQIQTLYRVGAIGSFSDGQLGNYVRTGRDDRNAEAAFTILVERHGPMVLRLCRQILPDRHDADDAFQATFLVLATRAHAIRNRESLASWLHGVARRVALRAKADAARRRIHERRAAGLVEPSSNDSDDKLDAEALSALHKAIARLPERYREPIVLCYLEGLTTEAASQRLGCPQGTVLSRLSRARERLRKTLMRRGVALPAAWLASEFCPDVAVAMPAAWLHATVRASLNFATKPSAEVAVASSTVINLARGTLYAMTIAQWKTVGTATLACVLAMASLPAVAQLGGSGGAEPAPTTEPASGQDRLASLRQSVTRMQAMLDEANRRNAELQKELQTIRAELKTLRIASPTAPNEGAGPAEERAASKPDVQAKDSDQLHYRKLNDTTIFISSPNGERIKFYNTRTKKSHSLNLLGSKEFPLTIRPVRGPDSTALAFEGPRITRIAAARFLDGPWYTQDLREPALGSINPIMGTGQVIYSVGQYLYAFSTESKRWNVLEVPKGATVQISSGGIPTVTGSGHIYTYDGVTGNWKDTDIRAIFDSPDGEEPDEAAVPRPQGRADRQPAPM